MNRYRETISQKIEWRNVLQSKIKEYEHYCLNETNINLKLNFTIKISYLYGKISELNEEISELKKIQNT